MQISNERLAELKEGWAHQASLVHDCSLAGSQYQSTCEDTAAALGELQQLRAACVLADHSGGSRALIAPNEGMPYAVDVVCGSSWVVSVTESRSDGLWMGSYRIDYDRDGNEIGRSDVTWNCRVFVQ